MFRDLPTPEDHTITAFLPRLILSPLHTHTHLQAPRSDQPESASSRKGPSSRFKLSERWGKSHNLTLHYSVNRVITREGSLKSPEGWDMASLVSLASEFRARSINQATNLY